MSDFDDVNREPVAGPNANEDGAGGAGANEPPLPTAPQIPEQSVPEPRPQQGPEPQWGVAEGTGAPSASVPPIPAPPGAFAPPAPPDAAASYPPPAGVPGLESGPGFEAPGPQAPSGDAEAQGADGAHAARLGKKSWLLLAATVVVFLVLGVLVGRITAPDPTTSEEYQSIAHELSSVQSQRSDLQDTKDYLDGRVSDLESEVSDLKDNQDEVDEQSASLDDRSAELDKREKALDKREKSLDKKEAEKERNTITEGAWTVGVDIRPGTYRTTEPVSADMCYWSIYVPGTNQADIVQNDIVTGGRPTVTLKKGQDFETERCGTWEKQ